MYDEFNRRKKFYSVLLKHPETIGWKVLKDIDTRKGPNILIFKRI